MNPLDELAEARIREAIANGELSNLPGEGKPLELEDDALVPEEFRMAYRILKNAGFLPPELQLRQEISEAEQLLARVEDSAEQGRALARLQALRLRLAACRGHRGNLRVEDQYYQRLIERLGRG